MNDKKQKLELTWIGKGEQPKLEPRILIEDQAKSYGNRKAANMLIYGDNLLALKALEQDFSESVKLVYIDPPFNTGAAFEHYDDSLEHSIWLDLMKKRFDILKSLLRKDGFLVVHLDDKEAAYAKVVLDEVFGRSAYLNTITVNANSPFGFKHTSNSIFKSANFLLVYSKSFTDARINIVYKSRGYDKAYKYILENPANTFDQWKWKLVSDEFAESLGFATAKEAKKRIDKEEFENVVADYAMNNATRVFRTAAVTGGAFLKRRETIEKSKTHKNKVFVHPNDDMGYYFLNGERILFYDARLQLIDGRLQPAEVLTDIWDDISWEGIASEGGVEFPKGKKPELLISRVIALFSNEGDLVIDSFLGSGTTAAVAHKMNRRWIGIELGDHCHTHCIPRLQRVCDGTDQGGVSELVNWKGGSGFKYYYLAPSLLQQDSRGNWIISKEYNAVQLAAAMAKQEGFRFMPDETYYWKQGKSTEKDFIFITTNFVSVELIDTIQGEMKEDESLLICCTSFSKAADKYPNITIKKIPKMLLGRCEFGKEDYSLNIVNMPHEDDEPDFIPTGTIASNTAKAKKKKENATADLFSSANGGKK